MDNYFYERYKEEAEEAQKYRLQWHYLIGALNGMREMAGGDTAKLQVILEVIGEAKAAEKYAREYGKEVENAV